jgi:hypothetical protein
VVDGTLVGPAAHRTLLARLTALGLAPEYRRFEPRLAEADLARYPVIVWLGGHVRGAAGSLAVGPDEVDRALRFVAGGGRLVLGVPYGRAVGGAEGRAMQAVLDRLGTTITVLPHEVVDDQPGTSYAATLMRAPLFAPATGHPSLRGLPARIVAARAAPLRVGAGASVLLRTHDAAFLDRLYGPPPDDPAGRRAYPVAALAAVGPGRVLVLSRDLLGAGGALANATFEPLAPGRLPAGAAAGRTRFLEAVLGEVVAGLPAAPRRPGDAGASVAGTQARQAAACRSRPGEAWLDREGARIAWGYVDRPEAEMVDLVARLSATGVNALWGPAGPARWDRLLEEPGAARGSAMAERTARRLAGTPVRWLAGLHLPGDRSTDLSRYPSAVSLGGIAVGLPSPVDERFWEETIVRRVSRVGRAAAEQPALAGVVLDLEMYGRPVLYYGDAFDFGEVAFGGFVETAPGLDAVARSAAARLPAASRADWLAAGGYLSAYYAYLERRAEGIGRRLRAALDEAAPGRDLLLGFYAVGVLPSWFYRGLWRGAGAEGRPVLLLTFQTDPHADLADAAEGGVCLRHALAVLLGLATPGDLPGALARAGREHDGFWINRITTLVAADPGSFETVERPAGLSADAAWRALRDGVDAFARARAAR